MSLCASANQLYILATVDCYVVNCNYRMKVKPNEICVIQQGIKFSIGVEGPTRG